MIALATRQAPIVDSPPALRLHTGGHWFVRIPKRLGGGSKWFGGSKSQAQRLYKKWTETEWLALCHPHHPKGGKWGRFTEQVGRAVHGGMPRAGDHPMSIQAAANSLFALVDAESGEHGRKKVRACLRKFLGMHGGKMAHDLTPADLIAFKSSLSELKPSSKNDLLVYSRRLLSHCWDVEAIQEPFRLKVLANVPKGELPDKAMSPAQVRKLIEAIYSEHPTLARICLLQFLIVGRPSEATKAVWHERCKGRWESEGVLAVPGKTTRKTGEPRRLLFSDDALRLLSAIGKPMWHRGDGKHLEPLCPNGFAYGQFCRRVGDRIKDEIEAISGKESLSPWGFRHAANQALLDAGVSEEDARKAAGHVRDRVRRAYGIRENYSQTRQSIGILSELVPLSIVGL